MAHAEDKVAVVRLQRADALTRLDDPALKPWYLEASYSLFDDGGQLAEQGKLEEWWAGPSLYKITITSPSYTSTTIVNKDGRFHTAGAAGTPALVELLERQIVHPMPTAAESSNAQMQKQAPGGQPMDCVMLNPSMRNVPFPQLGLFPTYCMEQGKNTLVMSYDYGAFSAARSELGSFQGRVMPVDVSLYLYTTQLAASHIVSLKAAELTDADFVVGAGMEPDNTQHVQVAYKVIKPTQIVNTAPAVPTGVDPSVMTEPVEIKVRVGTDGHIHSMRLTSTPDPQLATAALAAVMHWTYKPYLLNGKPVEVETSISYAFAKEGNGFRPGSAVGKGHR